MPYYVVQVDVPADALAQAGNLKLQAGMPAEVFIRTDSRTAADYLLAPVTSYLRRAMAVRPRGLKSLCAASCCKDAATRILLTADAKHAISIMSNQPIIPLKRLPEEKAPQPTLPGPNHADWVNTSVW